MPKQETTSFELAGRRCWWVDCRAGRPGPPLLVLMPSGDDAAEQMPQLLQAFATLAGGAPGQSLPFVLAGFEAADWDAALTPWPAPALFKGHAAFAGGAAGTLSFIETALLPEVSRRLALDERAGRALLGYSLAGLFSLWAFLRDEAFIACACCSGAPGSGGPRPGSALRSAPQRGPSLGRSALGWSSRRAGPDPHLRTLARTPRRSPV